MTEGEVSETPEKAVEGEERVPIEDSTPDDVGALTEHVGGLRQRFPTALGGLFGRKRKGSGETKDKSGKTKDK